METSPDGRGADQRAAVRSAEQAVSDAWIGQLLLAEYDAHVTVDVCTRIRARLADRLCVVRSLSTKEGDHGRGTYVVVDGSALGPSSAPSTTESAMITIITISAMIESLATA